MLFRRTDGRLLARWQPCDVKACPTCGPRLRALWAEQWAHVMGNGPIYRLVVPEGEQAKLRRRKTYRGREVAHIPAPDWQRVVYTTAPVGQLVNDVRASLASDFAAMPNDRRNRSMSGCRGTKTKARTGWLGVLADMEDEAAAAREPLECLGRIRRSPEHVAIAAQELGLLVGQGAGLVVMEAPPDMRTFQRLAALIGLQVRGHTPWKAAA
jgi:hypothetical protein